MGTNECSQPASKSSWDSQDFGDVNMVLKIVHFHKSSRPQWVNWIFYVDMIPNCTIGSLSHNARLPRIMFDIHGYSPSTLYLILAAEKAIRFCFYASEYNKSFYDPFSAVASDIIYIYGLFMHCMIYL